MAFSDNREKFKNKIQEYYKEYWFPEGLSFSSKLIILLRGDLPLATTYWVFFVFSGVLIWALLDIFSGVTIAVLALSFVSIIWFVITSVSVLRSAIKYTGPAIWGIIAIVNVIVVAVTVLSMFF